MRVMHLITTIEAGGAEKQLLILCQGQRKLGYEVHVVYFKGKPDLASQFVSLGVILHDLSHYGVLTTIYNLRKLSKCFKPDLSHSHLPRAEIFGLFISLGQKRIVSRHNSEGFWPKKWSLASKLLSRLVLSRSHVCICISESVRNFMLTSKEVSKRTSLIVVPYGFYPRQRTNPGRSSPNIEKEAIKILCIARLEPQKNLPTLFIALNVLKSSGIEFQLSLLGDGSLRESLLVLADDLSIASQIDWRRRVLDVTTLYDTHDLFILPSLYEGFGLVYLEALDARIPIITSRNEAALEIFGRNYPGFFEIGSAGDLVRCFTEVFPGELRKWIDLNAEKILTRHSAEVMTSRIDSIYKELLASTFNPCTD
jgi:glycosyltransferase involved in cell wall biosynthesis